MNGFVHRLVLAWFKTIDPDLGEFVGFILVDEVEVAADVREGVVCNSIISRHVINDDVA